MSAKVQIFDKRINRLGGNYFCLNDYQVKSEQFLIRIVKFNPKICPKFLLQNVRILKPSICISFVISCMHPSHFREHFFRISGMASIRKLSYFMLSGSIRRRSA